MFFDDADETRGDEDSRLARGSRLLPQLDDEPEDSLDGVSGRRSGLILDLEEDTPQPTFYEQKRTRHVPDPELKRRRFTEDEDDIRDDPFQADPEPPSTRKFDTEEETTRGLARQIEDPYIDVEIDFHAARVEHQSVENADALPVVPSHFQRYSCFCTNVHPDAVYNKLRAALEEKKNVEYTVEYANHQLLVSVTTPADMCQFYVTLYKNSGPYAPAREADKKTLVEFGRVSGDSFVFSSMQSELRTKIDGTVQPPGIRPARQLSLTDEELARANIILTPPISTEEYVCGLIDRAQSRYVEVRRDAVTGLAFVQPADLIAQDTWHYVSKIISDALLCGDNATRRSGALLLENLAENLNPNVPRECREASDLFEKLKGLIEDSLTERLPCEAVFSKLLRYQINQHLGRAYHAFVDVRRHRCQGQKQIAQQCKKFVNTEVNGFGMEVDTEDTFPSEAEAEWRQQLYSTNIR